MLKDTTLGCFYNKRFHPGMLLACSWVVFTKKDSTLCCSAMVLDGCWIALTMNDSTRDCSAMVLDGAWITPTMNNSTMDCSGIAPTDCGFLQIVAT